MENNHLRYQMEAMAIHHRTELEQAKASFQAEAIIHQEQTNTELTNVKARLHAQGSTVTTLTS